MKENRKFANVTGYTNALPQRSTAGSAGYDIASAETVTIKPGELAMIPTGIKAYMPNNEYLAVYPRSSLGIKRLLTMPNNVGIIDSDYFNNDDNEGHIYVPLFNLGKTPQTIEKGERITQGIFTKYLTTTDDNTQGKRKGGFGSTGC